MRTGSIVTMMCVAALALGACGGDEDETTELVFTDRDTAYEVEAGDQFTVILESNATTGYSWELAAELPEGVLRLVSDEYVAPDSDLVGAPGHQEITFEAVNDGSTFIQLWYVRSFDDPPEAADRAQFEVIVGTGAGDAPDPPGDADEPGSTIPDDENAISVGELLASSPSGDVVLGGALFDDGSGLVMCDALAESFPPQCVGDRVPIRNPDAISADFTEAEGVRWTDRVTLLVGRLIEGEFEVSS